MLKLIKTILTTTLTLACLVTVVFVAHAVLAGLLTGAPVLGAVGLFAALIAGTVLVQTAR